MKRKPGKNPFEPPEMRRHDGGPRPDPRLDDPHYCFHTGVEGRPGRPGVPGANGFSPTVETVRVPDGHEVRITDLDGVHVFQVKDGADGADGFSPAVETVRVRGGHEISITDADGEHVFLVKDGFDGSGLVARDGEGGCWYAPRLGDSEGDGLLAEDAEGNVWQYPSGAGIAGDEELTDGDGGVWYMMECGEGPQGPRGEPGPQGVQGERGDAAVALKSVTLSASWTGNGPYTQEVTIPNYTVTANSKVDLQPDEGVIGRLIADGVQALYVYNLNGTLTACAVGAAPAAAMTLQCTVTEVNA